MFRKIISTTLVGFSLFTGGKMVNTQNIEVEINRLESNVAIQDVKKTPKNNKYYKMVDSEKYDLVIDLYDKDTKIPYGTIFYNTSNDKSKVVTR